MTGFCVIFLMRKITNFVQWQLTTIPTYVKDLHNSGQGRYLIQDTCVSVFYCDARSLLTVSHCTFTNFENQEEGITKTVLNNVVIQIDENQGAHRIFFLQSKLTFFFLHKFPNGTSSLSQVIFAKNVNHPWAEKR